MTTLLLLGAALAAGPADPVSWEVDAATTAVLVEDHRVPLVELRLSFPAGKFSPWFNTAHAEEAFELQMFDTGGSLRARADALAADVSTSVDDFSSDLKVICLKEDLPAVRALLQDVLKNRDYDTAELKRAAKGRSVAWQASEKDFEFVLEQAGRRLLFAEGDPRFNKTEAPAALLQDAAKLAEARDQLVTLPGRIIGLAGDISRDEADNFARELLPAATAAPADLAPVYQPLRQGRPADSVVHLPNLTQTYFAYGREDIALNSPDYPAALLANHILGGHFYSRLYVALRHEGGETYGAWVARDAGPAPGPLALSTFTRTENEATTEEKLRGVLKTFFEGGVTEVELEEAKSAGRGRLLLQREAPGQILGTWVWERVRGLEPGFRAATVEAAATLTLDQINTFIRGHYDPAAFTMLKLEAEK